MADRGMPSADDLDAMRKQVLETDDIVIMDNLGSRKSRAVRQVIGQELHRSNSLQHFCSSRRPPSEARRLADAPPGPEAGLLFVVVRTPPDLSVCVSALTGSVLTLIVTTVSEERDNALAIAGLRGDLVAVRAETQAMESRIESRIDAGLARIAEDAAKRDTEAAKRETRLILTMIGLIVGAVTILGLLIRLD